MEFHMGFKRKVKKIQIYKLALLVSFVSLGLDL
jgi:hypothetical protein